MFCFVFCICCHLCLFRCIWLRLCPPQVDIDIWEGRNRMPRLDPDPDKLRKFLSFPQRRERPEPILIKIGSKHNPGLNSPFKYFLKPHFPHYVQTLEYFGILLGLKLSWPRGVLHHWVTKCWTFSLDFWKQKGDVRPSMKMGRHQIWSMMQRQELLGTTITSFFFR